MKDLALWVNPDERMHLVMGVLSSGNGTGAMTAAGLGACFSSCSSFEPHASLSGWGPPCPPALCPQTTPQRV